MWWGIGCWMQGKTRVEVLDTSVGTIPSTRWWAEIDGHPVASRRIGQRLYVISRFVPYVAGFVYGSTYAPTVSANQQLLAGTSLSDLLPQVRINGGSSSPAVSPNVVYIPA